MMILAVRRQFFDSKKISTFFEKALDFYIKGAIM